MSKQYNPNCDTCTHSFKIFDFSVACRNKTPDDTYVHWITIPDNAKLRIGRNGYLESSDVLLKSSEDYTSFEKKKFKDFLQFS